MVELRGEVTTPGEKPLNGITNVAEFLETQGGAKPTGDRARVQIIRNGGVVRVVDLTRYLRTEGLAYTQPEMEIRAGDTVFVPSDESQRFVVLGAVNKPGDYRALPGMTLVDALSLGDGLTKKAATQFVIIRNARSVTSGQALDKAIHFVRLAGRETVDGVVRIKYGRLVNGRAEENPVINPGDAVLVPEAGQLPKKLSAQDYVKKALSLILTIKGAKAAIPLLFPL
jgi:protein involved in polysaccharide export with SLBB domain